MKTIFKIIAGIIGAFIIMGVLFAGCTAFVFNEADKEITKQEDQDKKDSKKVEKVGTTKTYENAPSWRFCRQFGTVKVIPIRTNSYSNHKSNK